jgi:hypothetical protein
MVENFAALPFTQANGLKFCVSPSNSNNLKLWASRLAGMLGTTIGQAAYIRTTTSAGLRNTHITDNRIAKEVIASTASA